jgi:hypothetical protein
VFLNTHTLRVLQGNYTAAFAVHPNDAGALSRYHTFDGVGTALEHVIGSHACWLESQHACDE